MSNSDLAIRLFGTAARLVRRERELGEYRLGLRVPKMSALREIANTARPTSLEELAERELVSEPTMFATLRVLRKRRLVKTGRGRSGRRQLFAILTQAGESQLGFDSARLAELLSPATDAERETIRQATEILDRLLRSGAGPEKKRSRKSATADDTKEG